MQHEGDLGAIQTDAIGHITHRALALQIQTGIQQYRNPYPIQTFGREMALRAQSIVHRLGLADHLTIFAEHRLRRFNQQFTAIAIDYQQSLLQPDQRQLDAHHGRDPHGTSKNGRVRIDRAP